MDLQRFLYITKCVIIVVGIVISNLYCIPTYLVWMWGILLPFRLMNHPGYWYLEGVMFRWLLTGVAGSAWRMDLQRFLYITKCVIIVVGIVISNLYCIPTYLVWMWGILLPFRLMNHPGYWYLEGVMFRWLLTGVAGSAWRMDLQRFLYITKCVIIVIGIVISNLYCIPTYLVWMWGILLPFRLMNHPGYWYLEGVMFRWLLTGVAGSAWRMDLQRFLYITKCVIIVGDIVMSNLYCIPTYLVWMWGILLPFRLMNHPGYWYLEGVMFRWLLTGVPGSAWRMDLQRFLYITKCVIIVVGIVISNLYCIPTYLVWMWGILLPFRLMNHPGYWYLEGVMFRWLLTGAAGWVWSSKYQIVEMGDDISACTKDRCLFLVNHQSVADVPLMMVAFQEKERVLESIMWIMDRLFRYTNFGAVSVTHGDFFTTEGKEVRVCQMKRLKDHIMKVYLGRNRKWIVLFPEGGFLSTRLETSIKYATKNNFPILEHVALPRIGAMEVILHTLGPRGNLKDAVDEDVSLLRGTEEECEPLKWVIDVTIAYPDRHRPLDLLAICTSHRPPCSVYVHYRRYPINEVPLHSTESLRDWTYKRWSEKEELLKEYYSKGKFPHAPASQRPQNEGTSDNRHRHRRHEVRMDIRQIILIHTIFLSSSLFHCYLLYKAWNFVQY